MMQQPVDGGLDFEDAVEATKNHELYVLVSKHEDYGPQNIARAPGGPLMGLAVRLHDKLARLSHILEHQGEPRYESLADTMLDIANYGTIGQMVINGDWPGAEPLYPPEGECDQDDGDVEARLRAVLDALDRSRPEPYAIVMEWDPDSGDAKGSVGADRGGRPLFVGDRVRHTLTGFHTTVVGEAAGDQVVLQFPDGTRGPHSHLYLDKVEGPS